MSTQPAALPSVSLSALITWGCHTWGNVKLRTSNGLHNYEKESRCHGTAMLMHVCFSKALKMPHFRKKLFLSLPGGLAYLAKILVSWTQWQFDNWHGQGFFLIRGDAINNWNVYPDLLFTRWFHTWQVMQPKVQVYAQMANPEFNLESHSPLARSSY